MSSLLLQANRILSILLIFATLAAAQAPRLLKDINAVPISNPPSDPDPMATRGQDGPEFFSELGNKILLAATTRSLGRELWISDGTVAGTKLLKDIRPGFESSSPKALVVTNDGKRAFFWANDGKTGMGLWVTDGTSSGTKLVKNLTLVIQSWAPNDIVAFGVSSVIFHGYSPSHGEEPWISDGTLNGTRLLKDVQPGKTGSYASEFCPTGDGKKVFFSVAVGSTRSSLWWTDGTALGTVPVKRIQAGSKPVPIAQLVRLGASRVMFRAKDAYPDYRWWISDGSALGTIPLFNTSSGVSAHWWSHAIALGNRVLFEGRTNSKGTEVYVTDGTPQGTKLLIDAFPGKSSSGFRLPRLDSTGKKVYWIGQTKDSYHGRFLVSDGTPAGTKVFGPILRGMDIGSPIESGGRLYFPGRNITPGTGWELCVSDGTVAGTKTLRDTAPGAKDGGAGALTRTSSGALFYVADDQVHGRELWVTKGGKSFQLLDINNPQPSPTGDAWPLGIVRFGKYMVFSAFDGVTGTETWISDGTTAGTRRLKDLAPGITSSLSHYYAVAGDRIVFDAFTPTTGMELFVTDGTPAGTKLLKDIRPGSSSSYPSFLTSVGDKVFFASNDGTSGFEPWVTDGTTVGTHLVKNLYPGSWSSSPYGFAGQGDKIVFGAVGPDNKSGLYLTDGTARGTKLLKAIGARGMVYTAGRVFFAGYTSSLGGELWVTDFTSQGTTLVKDLMPGFESGLQSFHLSARNGRVFFVAYTKATSGALFVSNGSSAGTRVFLGSGSGSLGYSASNISAIGSRKVYFSGVSKAMGNETVVTDGTASGTRILDVNPGPRNGAASFRFAHDRRAALGSQVFFPARHPVHGVEIFTIDNGATAEPIGSPYGSTWIEGSDPVLGRTAYIQGLTGLPNPVHLTVMGTLAARPVRFVAGSVLHIDLSSFFRVTPVVSGVQIQHSIPIPGVSALKGVQLVFQTLAFDANNFTGTLELSNGLHWTLGN